MKELTPEYIQKKIDQYEALMEGHKRIGDENGDFYYLGKHCAWVDVYDILYPEKQHDRAFPRDEELRKTIIENVRILKQYANDNTRTVR